MKKTFCFIVMWLGLSSLPLHAQVQRWSFDDANEYRFDSEKVELSSKGASLKRQLPYRDESQSDFDTGIYAENTWAAHDKLELIPSPGDVGIAPQPPVPIEANTPGLAALWNLDEPSGTNILDGVGRNIAKVNDAEIVSGQTGFHYARLLDGIKSHIFIPNYEALNFKGAFTLETWFRPVTPLKGKSQALVSRWQGIGAQKSFALKITEDGKLELMVSADGATVVRVTGDTVLNPGRWYHAAAVYTGSELRIYLNGVLDGPAVAFSSNLFQTNIPLYVGALIDQKLTDFFEGVVDEIALYSTALSETQIANHFGNLTGMVGWWKLDERGGILEDSSGYGHNAVVSGKPEYGVSGKRSLAMRFEGKQHIEIPPSQHFSPEGNLHLEAWVYLEKMPDHGKQAVILSSVGETQDYGFSIAGPAGKVQFTASSLSPSEFKGKTSLMPKEWHFVSAAVGNGEVRIYVDGELDASLPYDGFLLPGKTGLRIGADKDNLFGFRGLLDEVAVYRRAKSSAEVAMLAGKYPSSGQYLSHAVDAGSQAPWQKIAWEADRVYGQPYQDQEKGLLYLLHLDEADETGVGDSKEGLPFDAMATYSVPGIFSNARWFAKAGYDKLISIKPIPSLSTYTFSFWVQFKQPQAIGVERLLTVGNENPSIYRSGPGGHIEVVSEGARKLVSDSAISDTAWHHIALTSDGRSLALYLDGQLNGITSFVRASDSGPMVLGNLKAEDTFEGAMDECALFNYGMDKETILNHVASGKADVRFWVRTSDNESFANAFWRGPKGNTLSELEPTGSTVALWHFNEKVLRGAAHEVADASNHAQHGVAYGSQMSSSEGVIGRGVHFNGSSDYIEVADSDMLHLKNAMTLSAWIRPEEVTQTGARILDKKYLGGAPTFSSFSLELLPGNRLGFRLGHGGGYFVEESGKAGLVAVGRWNHVAATFDGKIVKLFVNGKLVKSGSYHGEIVYDKGPLLMGRYGQSLSGFFMGSMDEVLIASEAMSDNEVAMLYAKADPENCYRGGMAQKVDVAAGRFFQYQSKLNTEIPSLTPSIGWVSVQGNDFSVEKPWVTNAISVSFADLTDFRPTLGAEHKGAVSYQISNDGSNWYYHNGRHWVAATRVDESNTDRQVSSYIRDFIKEVGIGSFYFRAFLHSMTGIENAQLESVELEFLPNKVTVISPNGKEAWMVGTEQMIQWRSSGDLQTVRIEYSKDQFQKDFHVIGKDIQNTGSYRWTIPDDVYSQVQVRVMSPSDPRIYDVSDITFRITGAFEIVSPNYNERWEVGSKQQILWKTQGSVREVKLDYSTDQFKNEIYQIVDSVKNEGSFTWTVPDRISNKVKVRVSDVRDPETFDASNDTMTIHGGFSFLTPVANEHWTVGSNQEIQWKTTGTISTLRLELGLRSEDETGEERMVIEEILSNRGSYVLQVPDRINSHVVVYLTDTQDEKTTAESLPFSITAGMQIIHPALEEYWSVGSKRKIAWQTVGTVSAVNIEYAELNMESQRHLRNGRLALDDKKLAWKTIENDATNIGSYTWLVPDTLMDAAVVRVVDASNPQVGALASNVVHIIPGFSLKSPNGGEAWAVGTEETVEWETKGTIEYVRLEYSKDEFIKDVHTIIERASNVGRFSWTVPDDVAARVWVRVSDPDVPQASDISDAPMRIYGTFRILTPTGGEKYEVGSLGSIEWENRGTISDVKIEYSKDDFNQDARVMVPSIPNKGQFTWTVPDDIGTGYKIRISDAHDPLAFSISEGVFSVAGKFYLLNPVGGENFVAGTVQKITWKGAGSISFIRIDYSEDDFTKTFFTLAEAAPNTGSFNWEVPNRLGQSFKIRIWDPSHPESMVVMENPAKIIGGFTLISPNGGEVLYVGDSAEITWKSFGSVERVKLELSNDNFIKNVWEMTDVYENTGKYTWHVQDLPSGAYKVRVSDTNDPDANDMSNSDFRIRSRMTLLSPVGGEGWAVGETHTIKWKTSGSVQKIKLEYSTDNFQSVSVISDAVPNTGMYDWTVPNHVSQSVKIRVSDLLDPEAFATSDSSLKTQAVFNLKSPVGGEIWRVGQTYPIVWETTGDVKAVRIEYSRDGFASESKTIIASTSNMGSYNWTIPDEISRHTKIRLIDVSNSNTQVMSPAPFQIMGSFQVIGPNGGEAWHAIEKREISWVTVGTIPEVDIRFCPVKEKGATDCSKYSDPFFIINKNMMNTGRYVWDIPRIIGDRFLIQVCDSQNPEICDQSDVSFEIRSPFEIVYPRSADMWPVGSDQELRWHTYGNVTRVLIQYANRDLADKHAKSQALIWKTLGEGLENAGAFRFKVPDEISKNIIFKVADWDDEALYSVSKEPVMFTATFTVLTPNGGEKWAAGTTQKIVWDTLGTLSNVKLEYSRDRFERDVNVIESSYPNTGHYEWTLPDTLAPGVSVRVSDAANPKAFDTSDQGFKLMPGFILLAPDGGEVWSVASEQKILWKTIGQPGKVRLEFQTGPEGEWKKIAEDLQNSGTCVWKIPDEVTRTAKVRVMEADEPDAWSASHGVFEIRPEVKVAFPNGREKITIGVPVEIRWINTGTVGKVRIEYSKDGFKKDIHLIAASVPNGQKYEWVPLDDVTDAARIRVTEEANDKVFDLSDEAFRILPQILVLSPKGDERWAVDSEQSIQWDWSGTLDKVTIEASRDNFVSKTLVAKDIPNTGKFVWKVPDFITTSLRIRVEDARHPEAFGISKSVARIHPAFTVNEPVGLERWVIGEKQKVRWSTAGTCTQVSLQYALNQPESEPVWRWIAQSIANKGEFVWEIPNEVSSHVKLRVLSSEDPDAYGESTQEFKILGKFSMEAPEPNQVVFVNDKVEIKWQTLGQIFHVKVEYTSKELLTGQPGAFELIEAQWPNKGSLIWTVPDAISEHARIRISDAREPDTQLVSLPFRIRGKLQARPLEGLLNWPVGSTQTLAWDSMGSIEQVDLSYLVAGQSEWKIIARNVTNTGRYGWKVPEDISQNVRIRIADASNPYVMDEFRQGVTIAARFEFKSPSAEQVWHVGDKKEILWVTRGKVQKVYLEYTQGESGWMKLAGPMPDVGRYLWEIPDSISSAVRIRVRDADNEWASEISPTFVIRGALETLRPQDGDVLVVGTPTVIQWKTRGTIPEVKLEYLVHRPTVPGVAAEVQAVLIEEAITNKNEFEWLVPDAISDNLQIRVTDVRDSAVVAVTPEKFSIIGGFTLLSPKGGEVWPVGTHQQIVWIPQGSVEKVKVEYSRDDFYQDKNLIETNVLNSGMLTWKVPDMLSSQVTIRITDVQDSRAHVVLTTPFKITGLLEWGEMGANETWTVGDSRILLWNTTGTIEQVRLEYSRDGFQKDVQIIKNTLKNENRFEWKVPDSISKELRIRVLSLKDKSVFAVSNPVKVQGQFHFVGLDRDENLEVTARKIIQWKTTGSIAKVNLDYSRDEFDQHVNVIALDLPNTGKWDWTIPDDLGGDIKIRVRDASDARVVAVSDGTFSIIGKYVLISPKAGEVLYVGDPYEAAWKTLGSVSKIKVEISQGNQAPVFAPKFETIENEIPNKGLYHFTVPDLIGENVRLRISDAANPESFLITHSFSIRGKIQPKPIEGASVWPLGSMQTIAWETLGTIPRVDITYKTPLHNDWKAIVKGLPNTGSFGWTVPAEVLKDVSIRIASSAHALTFGEVKDKVTLIAQFEWVSPERGESLTVGTRKELQWKTLGKIEKVWLEYAVSGDNWIHFAGPVPDTGKYQWTVPDSISNGIRLRIRDDADMNAYSVSPVFEIRGALRLMSPVGEEIWKVGSTQRITWKTAGLIPQVKIEYVIPQANETGAEEKLEAVPIKENAVNQGFFDWIVPDRLTNDIKVRISDVRDPGVFAVSPASFSVIGAFSLVTPQGGEVWAVGTNQQITWVTRGSVSKVNMEYSRDEFYRDLNPIGTDIPNTGVAIWKIPDSISDHVSIRISDASDARAVLISEKPIKITGTLLFTGPADGEIWTVEETKPLTWLSTGTIPKVRLEYSRDDFQKDIQIITNAVENTDRFEWKVPDVITARLKFRVSNAADSTVFAVSAPIQVQGRILLTTLQKYEPLTVLGHRLIKWDTIGSIPKVRVDYSRDHFQNDVRLIASNIPNEGMLDWQIPDDIGPGVQIRVMDEYNPKVKDVTPEPLEIRGALAFVEGAQPERLAVGAKKELYWNSTGTIPSVRLEYDYDEEFTHPRLMADGIKNRGAYVWNVPDDISEQIILRVTDTRNENVFSTTQVLLSIVGTLKIVEPRGGVVQLVGAEQPIRWSSIGSIAQVRLEYSSSRGQGDQEVLWNLITGAMDNTGVYNWTVPNEISDQIMIRISDAKDPLVYSVTDAPMAILGGLQLIEPRGHERFIVGTQHEIIWNAVGDIAKVRLEYSRDQFVKDVNLIQDKVPNTGHYAWTIPDALSEKIHVRVVNAEDERVRSVNKQPFSIIGDFIFLEDEGDLVWNVGSEQKIRWQTIGTIPQIKLEYSLPIREDSSAMEFRTIGEGIINTGSFTWKIPDRIGEGMLIRISDMKDPETSVLSQKSAKVTGGFVIQTPKGGEQWLVGAIKKVEWQTLGTVSRVDLEFSTDGFQEKTFVIEKSLTNENSFFWQIPDGISKDVFFRIKDSSDASVAVTSQPFEIMGALKLLQPAGDRIFRVGERRRLEWQTIGSISNIQLDYSRDQFVSHSEVIDTLNNNLNHYDWLVPDVISKKIWIRVRSADDVSVSSVLHTPVEIQGEFRLLNPSPREVLTVGQVCPIEWKWAGTIPKVRLEYSDDDFQRSQILIADKIPNTGNYEWRVPDFIRRRVNLRVLNASDPSVGATLIEPFKIQGGLEWISLAKDEIWRVGEKKLFEWNTAGTIPQLRLEYSSDEFRQDIHVISDGLSNQGTLQWLVPGDLSGNVRFRLSDARDSNVVSFTKGLAKVFGTIQMITPRGNEDFVVGQSVPVQWKSDGEIPKVALEYSTDGFQYDIHEIEKILTNEGTYQWEVPDCLGEGIQIRVRDAANTQVYGISRSFAIQGALDVIRPTSSDVFRVGTEEAVQWRAQGSMDQYRLEYSLDFFKEDVRVISQSVPSSRKEIESFVWQVPDAISDHVWLRVVDVKNPKAQAMMMKPFKIKGILKLLTPAGGEILRVGDKHSLNWKTTGNIPSVRIEVSRDGFKRDIQTVVDQLMNQGQYDWQVPDLISDHVWVRVLAQEDLTVFASHEKPMTIHGGLRLLNPVGGEIWPVGSNQTLQWRSIGSIEEVRLEYTIPNAAISKGKGEDSFKAPPAFVIQDRLPNRGSFVWRIPDRLPAAIRLRVVDATNPLIFDEAQEPVKLQPKLRILTPNKKEKWTIGSTHEINWQSQGELSNVKIQYSRDEFKRDIGDIAVLAPNVGSARWQIPDIAGKNVLIRVLDPNNVAVQAVSETPVEIVGEIRVDFPKGGERWLVGNEYEITWDVVGTIPQVNIEYSKDRFIKHREPIQAWVANIGRYVWKVPDDMSSNVWIRVADSRDPEVGGMTQEPLAIVGNLFLKYPSGVEIWNVGDMQTIQWDTVGSIPMVRLEYSTDDFQTAVPMSSQINNEGQFEWKVPDLVTHQLKLRISDARDPKTFSTSLSPVKIQGALSLISPREEDFWVSGNLQTVSWTTRGSVPYVNLEYSGDHFANATPIVLGLANSGSYSWTVPDVSADKIQIRITNAQDQNVSALSGLFQVGGTLEVLTPSGGEIWRVGDQVELRWKTKGTIPTVKIEASSDQFQKDVLTIAMSADNKNFYTWRIPDWVRSFAQVRVSDAKNPNVSHICRGTFKVVGNLDLVEPRGGELWHVGSPVRMIWKTTGNIPSVRIEYSTDDFQSMMPIAMDTPNTGSYDWKVPDLVDAQIKVRVADAQEPTVTSEMLQPARIMGGLMLVQPAGGELFAVGSEQLISWKTLGTIPRVSIETSNDDFVTVQLVASNIVNRGSYLWRVPNAQSNNVRIRIVDASSPSIFDALAKPVQILGEISLLSPRPNEVYVVGSDLPIRWQTSGNIDQVRIEFSTDHFRTSSPVVNAVPNTGEYIWKVADAISKTAKIRLVDVNHSHVEAVMKDAFEIQGVLRLASPAGGEVWSSGQRYPLMWQTLGTIPQVRLEYSRDGFLQDTQLIAATVSNKGAYYWEVPANVSGEIYFRIQDTQSPRVSDMTRTPVRIVGNLEWIYPVAGETFRVGERVDIQWKSSPNVDAVKLEYSTDDFVTSEIISSAAPNARKFSWTIPDKISDQVKLRISDTQNASVFSVSKVPFRIQGALKLLYPMGGEVWTTGSDQTITWTTNGVIQDVRIEYSGDDFETVMPIETRTQNTGSYVWNVPEMRYRDIKVRVVNAADTSVYAVTPGSLRILGQVRWIYPAGGERLISGSEKTIKWQSTGAMTRVSLEYSKDDFRSDIHVIARDVPNLGSFLWTVPNDCTGQVKLRVRSSEDAQVSAVSESFKIDVLRIQWVVKDAQTQKHLTGLTLTDSAGRTQQNVNSPVTLERPYGIYTTIWSKPGYQDYKNTWVAEEDRVFAVMLEKAKSSSEKPRVDFNYDAASDLMRIQCWFERDGRSVPNVMMAEVRIYDGTRLLHTLTSTNPDLQGVFSLVWNTQGVAGNARYLASASITLNDNQVISTPINFQIDLPVKQQEKSTFVENSKSGLAKWFPLFAKQEKEGPSNDSKILGTEVVESVQRAIPTAVTGDSRNTALPTTSGSLQETMKLSSPDKAVLNETITIRFVGQPDSHPALDIYASDRTLIVRGQALTPDTRPGEFYYMLPIRGLGFIPGQQVLISVVDRNTGDFVTKSVRIETSSSALGLQAPMGDGEVLDVLYRMEQILAEIREMDKKQRLSTEPFRSFEKILMELGVSLGQAPLNSLVVDKLNKISYEIANLLNGKGFDSAFLVQKPLSPVSDLMQVNEKVRQFQAAVNMLERLYQYTGAF